MIYTYIYKLVTEEPYITQEKSNLQVQFCRNTGKTPHYTVGTEQFTTQVRTKDLIQNEHRKQNACKFPGRTY